MTKQEALQFVAEAHNVVNDIATGQIQLIDLMALSMAASDALEEVTNYIEDVVESAPNIQDE